MIPDLTKARKFKNVQIGKDITLIELYMLPDGQVMINHGNTKFTPQQEAIIANYLRREWLPLEPIEPA